jgi:hypothetical protein
MKIYKKSRKRGHWGHRGADERTTLGNRKFKELRYEIVDRIHHPQNKIQVNESSDFIKDGIFIDQLTQSHIKKKAVSLNQLPSFY